MHGGGGAPPLPLVSAQNLRIRQLSAGPRDAEGRKAGGSRSYGEGFPCPASVCSLSSAPGAQVSKRRTVSTEILPPPVEPPPTPDRGFLNHYYDMSYVTNQSTTDSIKMRLEILRNYQHSVVRSGDERLRVAMAEYAQQFRLPLDRELA